jgi:hypothetical protein
LQKLFRELRDLALPCGDYAIFGSGPLIVRGIIAGSNDLDVICRRSAWERVQSIGEIEYLEEYGVTIVTLSDGRLTFGTAWGIGQFNVDALIDDAEEIDGLPFVRLEHVISYKMERGSRKDLEHIEAIEKSSSNLAHIPN